MGKKVKKGLSTVTNVITLGGYNKAKKEIKKLTDPEMPEAAKAPETAPVADDAAVRTANRRRAAARAKSGRAGTLLTEGNTLG